MEEDLAKKADVLTKLADTEAFSGDFSAAGKHYEEALELYHKLGDLPNVAMAHLMLARGFAAGGLGLGNEVEALKHMEAALAIAEPGPNTPEKAFAYQFIAHQHLHTEEPTTCLVWAQKAVDLFQKLGMFMGTSLGTAQARTGEVDKGIEYQEDNWEPTLQGGNPGAIMMCGHDIILTHTLVRNMPRALEWGATILREVTKTGAVFLNAVNRPLVLMYTLSGEISKAMETCQTVESVESKTAGLVCWLEGSVSPGFLRFRLGEWDKAGEVLQAAVSAHEDRHNAAGVNACSFALGSLNMELGDYPKAEELLLRSLEICRKGGNLVSELWVLPVLAELYLKMGQPDKAAEYVDRGFELLKPDRNWYGLPAPMYLAKGMLATAQEDWEAAAESFGKAIQLNRRYQLPWDEAKTLYERGLMHLARGQEGDREKAHADLDEALAIFQRVEAKKDVEKVLGKKEMLGA